VVERLELLLAGGLDWPHVEAGWPLRRRCRGDPRAAPPHPGRARARAAEAAAPGRHRGGGRHTLKPKRQLFLSSSDLATSLQLSSGRREKDKGARRGGEGKGNRLQNRGQPNRAINWPSSCCACEQVEGVAVAWRTHTSQAASRNGEGRGGTTCGSAPRGHGGVSGVRSPD